METAFYRDPAYMDDGELRTQVDGVKAFVTIMQGCNKVCSFCIVPHVRGREVSRPSDKILAEIESLARHGVKEVMLLGQNVNSYGKLTPGELSFAELLARVDAIDGLRRIRFTTSHPQDLSPELIEDFATLEKSLRASPFAGAVRFGFRLDAHAPRLHQGGIFGPPPSSARRVVRKSR